MLSNLVLAGLLVSLSSLPRNIEGVLQLSSETNSFSLLNEYLTNKTNDPGVKANLNLIKELASEDSRAKNPPCVLVSQLAQELAKLDVDKPCDASGLAGLRKSVEIIEAVGEKVITTREPESRLGKVIADFAIAARERCFEEIERNWSEGILPKLFDDYWPDSIWEDVLDQDEGVSKEQRFENALKRIKSTKMSFSIGHGTRILLKSINKGDIRIDKRTGKKLHIGVPQAEALINLLLVKPCEEFSQRPIVRDVVKPLVDLAVVLGDTHKHFHEGSMRWQTCLLSCEWLMNLDRHKLAKKTYRWIQHPRSALILGYPTF